MDRSPHVEADSSGNTRARDRAGCDKRTRSDETSTRVVHTQHPEPLALVHRKRDSARRHDARDEGTVATHRAPHGLRADERYRRPAVAGFGDRVRTSRRDHAKDTVPGKAPELSPGALTFVCPKCFRNRRV